jgi:hypothetical protein
MIRADSTLADARCGSVFPHGKQNDSAQQTGRPQNRPGRRRRARGIGELLGAIGPEDTRRYFEPGLAGHAA